MAQLQEHSLGVLVLRDETSIITLNSKYLEAVEGMKNLVLRDSQTSLAELKP